MCADRARDFLTRIEASNVGAETLTQTRTGYACADNAGHDELRAWIRGLQTSFTYVSGRLKESLHYAQLGTEVAARSQGTARVWMASGEAARWPH